MAKKSELENEEKGIGSIFSTILIIISIPIMLLAGTIIYKAYAYPDKIPDVFGYKPMIVLSSSMETSLYAGDLVFIKIVETDTLKENDVIAFRNESDKVTTHRIVGIENEDGKTLFRTKGDSNNVEDEELVSEEDIEGIYVSRIAGLGSFLIFMQKPINLIIIILIILVIGLTYLNYINRRDEKKYIEELEKERKEFEEFKKMKNQKNKEEKFLLKKEEEVEQLDENEEDNEDEDE